MRGVLALGFVALALAGPAVAAHTGWTPDELERELTCPTCQTTLAMSDAPVADRMRVFIRARHDAGDTKGEVKEKLVAEFGEGVLAAPPPEGFNLLAWVLPIGGAVAAGLVLGFLAWRWARGEKPERPGDPASNGRVSLDPELERRLDEELARFEG